MWVGLGSGEVDEAAGGVGVFEFVNHRLIINGILRPRSRSDDRVGVGIRR